MKRALAVVVSIISCLMLVGSVSAFPPAAFHRGDEVAILGHSFDEEYWTNASMKVKTPAGDNVTFSTSYVNYSNVQAFLFSLNSIENVNGTGTIPFQLFGLHYYTPEKNEVFIGAIFAFLMAFNDTYNGTGPGSNGLPDPGHEQVYYTIPFGAASIVNETYVPTTNVLAVQKLGVGHYTFGIQYLNLYAFVTDNFAAAILLKTFWVAKFSELTVKYDVKIDNKTGEVKVESKYTIGQISKLWWVVFGYPIPADPHKLPAKMGISVVHFLTVFTSKYSGAAGNTTGSTINPDITLPVNEDILVKVGNDGERAMKIGTRGTFDLVNETSGAVLKHDQPAMSAIVSAKKVDLALVAWQLGFAAGTMSIFAYALSKDVQSKYSGPLDLMNRSLVPGNADGFNAKGFWYAVAFPEWNGYRVVHDPVYTAYANSAQQPAAFTLGVGLAIAIIVIPLAIVIAVIVANRRRKGA